MNNILKQSQGQSLPIAPSVPDRAWHTMTPNEVESHFGTDSSTGLDEATVLQRLAQFGPNRLAAARQQSIWQVFLEEIREPLILLLRGAGQRVPADARLLESYSLAADEASLTGESVPVEKDAHLLLPDKTALAERSNMLYAGTMITRGHGTAIVVATGMRTELGQVVGI